MTEPPSPASPVGLVPETAVPGHDQGAGGWINGIVRTFLQSNLSIILLVISVAVGAAALLITPREEDPQIVVPLADIYVDAPGLSSQEVERLVTTPLERVLYQIDGVEYVYSMSRTDSAIVTVRFYVGEDRERSLVRLFKKLEESKDLVPPGVAGWVMKPVEIDDVPVVTLTLRGRDGAAAGSDEYTLRRVAEETAARLAAGEDGQVGGGFKPSDLCADDIVVGLGEGLEAVGALKDKGRVVEFSDQGATGRAVDPQQRPANTGARGG